MKKAIATIAVLAAAMVIPATASADTLSMSYARNTATNVALNWYLSGPADSYFVDACHRRSAHKVACDANVTWTDYGSLSCPSYSSYCHETDTDHWCWKTVTVKLNQPK